MNIPAEQKIEQTSSSATARTVDGEGLLNNYAIEPKMYEEDGGAVSESATGDRVTVVDIFPSEAEAKNAVKAMQLKGLRCDQISVIAKNYLDSDSLTNWESIVEAGGLAEVLTDLGISDHAITEFESAIVAGNFLVIAIGDDREASQAQHALESVGHCVDVSA